VSVAEGQKRIVAHCEERTPQRGVDAELVVRPLDGDQRVAYRHHLFAGVERTPPDQHVRDVPHLERPHVGPRHVLSELLKALEEQAHVSSLDRHLFGGPPPLGDREAALVDQEIDERSHGVGNRVLDLELDDFAPVE
jgi:hypothetical protein